MLDSRLRPLVLDRSAEDLARYLYGPRWREAMSHRADGLGWVARRGPLPGDLARLLTDLLSDVLAHDGRSTHENRSGGWWLLAPPTGFVPAAPATVADLLREAVEEVLAEAMLREEAARDDAEGADLVVTQWQKAKPPRPGRVAEFEQQRDAALREARQENLRAGLLSGLRVTAASSGRAFEGALWTLRSRHEFRLNEEARQAIAFDWFEERLDLGEFAPDAANRVAIADVKAAHATDDGPALPWRSLHRALTGLLGEPHRRIAWSLDRYDEVFPKEIPA